MKTKILCAILLIAVAAALIVYAQTNRADFAPAADFPRGALVYAQIGDLPAFVRLLNESKFAAEYAASVNFANFRNNHLGRKLASRWREFNDAAGFSFDLETVAGLTENRAAIAVYDVGKLEFVFAAPLSAELFAASAFLRNREKYAQETLDGGTVIYRVRVEADRGRQKQELIFAHVENRLVLATSERLLAQTLNNIGGAASKNRLSDEPAFAVLSDKIEPHLATVWVDQTALNDDYYFKRYWLMSDAAPLENIRAGIFDFEMRDGKLLEHRRFLLDEVAAIAPLESEQTGKLLARVPENIPFYRLRRTDAQATGETIEKTIFEPRPNETERNSSRSFYSSFGAADDAASEDYDYLSGKFDENVDENEADEAVERPETKVDFAASLAAANPRAVLTFARPQVEPAPLFVDFRRAAIFYLGAPEKFDREAFESAIKEKFAAQTMIAAPEAEFVWETKTDDDSARRELKLPMLEWRAVYALRGDTLILTNDTEFFREIDAAENNSAARNEEKEKIRFAELTVVNLSERKAAYDDVFDRLREKQAAEDFFTGSVKSLFDAASRIARIEIRKNYSRNILEEELIFSYQPAALSQ